MTTVSLRLCCRLWINSSNSAAAIGSRPAVGSSRNRISGSRASARARPARFFMPPESSDGNLAPASGARPTRRTFRSAISRRSCGERLVCSLRGVSTFSVTVSELNRAPFWNSTPQRSSIWRRSRSFRSSIDLPRISIEPAAGRLRPMMVRSSTDLPLPEPPTMPRTSPRFTSRSTPSCTTCGPKRLTMPRRLIAGCGMVGSFHSAMTQKPR